MSAASDFPRSEVAQAQRFVRWVVGQDCELDDTPDARGRQSRPGGNPDAVFQDPSGQRYVVEVTRLLTQEVRKLESFASERIAVPLSGKLPGTFLLELRFPRHGRLCPDVAASIVQQITELTRSSRLPDSQVLASGFPLRRVRPEGSRVVPWIIGPSLPYDLREDDPSAGELKKLFEEQMREADRKFQGWDGNRILLMDIGQSGLDEEFHAGKFRGGQGILLTWAESTCAQTQNMDFLFLEPGVHVWQPTSTSGEMVELYAGHRYVDATRGFYPLLWCRADYPGLTRFGLRPRIS